MAEDALFILTGAQARLAAKRAIDQAPMNTRVSMRGPKRTLPQNDRMHAMLTDIARQTRWHGQKLHKDDWKLIFLAALDSEMRIVPNLAGDGFVPLGRSSSKLSREQMSDLLELIAAFGAERGVIFHDEAREADGAKNPAAASHG